MRARLPSSLESPGRTSLKKRRAAVPGKGTFAARPLALMAVDSDALYVRVYNELSQALMTGVFRPGEPVTLRQLVKSLGVSMMPVRGAISRLIAEHALEMLPNRSVIVPRMSREKFHELWQLRQALEGQAAAEACRRADRVLVQRLRAVNQELRASITARDLRTTLLANRDFHFIIYEASRLQVVPSVIGTLWLQAGPFLYFSYMAKKSLWTAFQHSRIIKAFEARDSARAREAIEQDIGGPLEYLLEHGIYSE